MFQTTSQESGRVVYADIIGQEGTTTKQLFDDPPEGYRFVTRRKLSTAAADSIHARGNIQRLKQYANAICPVNLMTSLIMRRYMSRPAGAVLTYSESSVVFRDEPWVLWLEDATQLAGHNDGSLRRFRVVIEGALSSPNCRSIVCHSEAARGSLRRHLRADSFEHKLHVMRPGWRLTPYAPAAKPANRPVRILFVVGSTMACRFRIKGGLELLQAFAVLRQRFPGLELVVRSDVEPEIRRHYENMPGLRIVSSLVPYEQLERMYRESDIYLYPAHYLGSVSVLEAMNYGLPVITTDYYDNPEYVEDGRTGMIIPHHRHLPPWDTSEMKVRRALETPDPHFVKALVEKTAVLIESAELRRRMGRAGREDLEKRFSLTEKNRKLKNILDLAVRPE
jgi:glycosyltransferase involved in cell wall biosynthesis